MAKSAAKMSREELYQELREKEVDGWSTKNTLVELRAVLQVVRKMYNPAGDILKGMGSKCWAELRGMYRELGLGEPGSLTKGLLMAEIRAAVMGTQRPPGTERDATTGHAPPEAELNRQEPNGKTETAKQMKFETKEQLMVRFGRHRGTSYQNMMKDFPNYCEWVLDTDATEPEAGPDLQHFAVYLKMQGFNGRAPIPQETTKKETEEESQASGSGQQAAGLQQWIVVDDRRGQQRNDL